MTLPFDDSLAPFDNSDLHRADEACDDPAYDAKKVREAVVMIIGEAPLL